MKYWVSIGIAVMWSTGFEKKPCTWPECRSIVSTRSTPTASRHWATTRAEVGGRGAGGADAGGARLARRGFFVLTQVAVPGHDRNDPVRGGALGGVDHHHQL